MIKSLFVYFPAIYFTMNHSAGQTVRMYELPQFLFYALGKFTKRKVLILLDSIYAQY